MFKGLKVWECMTSEGMNTGGRDSTKSKGNLQICSSDHCFCVMWVLKSTRCGNHCTWESFLCIHNACKSSLVAQTVKNLPAMQETWVWFLDQEDPRRRKSTPVFLPREFHGQRSLAGYSPWGRKESDTTERLIHTHTHTHAMHVSILKT